jgi:hypothetical protein
LRAHNSIVQIQLTKISDRQHALEIVRTDGSRERVELVTREALFHDFLHYAVELLLPTQRGFWGTLAGGKSFGDLNDRTGESVKENAGSLYQVEGIVGLMSGVMDLPADRALARLRWFSESQRQAPPEWCTEQFVSAVSERMRQLKGQWKATPYGHSLEIDWPETAQQ